MHTLNLKNKKVLVQGLGRFGGGVGVARFLASQGALVTVTDLDPAEKLSDSMKQLADLPITYHLGGHTLADFTSADLIIANPAVDKPKNEFIQAALKANVPVTTEMNLFLQLCPAYTIAITGSVGKSTTTTLIHLAIQAALCKIVSTNPREGGVNVYQGGGYVAFSEREHAPKTPQHPTPDTRNPRVFLGGNIGKSLLPDLPSITPNDIVVLEISSFMLEDTPALKWSPNIALVTNLYPNHLDRHHTMEEYASVKQNLLRFQKPTDFALLNADHPLVSTWHTCTCAQVNYFTTKDLPTLPLQIPGLHNQSNARAALAVLDALSTRFPHLDKSAALQALQTFTGLSHRLQLVHTSQNLRWFNDSKATTPDASITALQAFAPGEAFCIVGGYDKHIDMSAFEKLLATHAGGVLGIGQTGQALIAHVKSLQPLAGPRVIYVETLENAITQATQWAQESPQPHAVLLSPASASWGQFQNYEQRGDRFATLAQALP